MGTPAANLESLSHWDRLSQRLYRALAELPVPSVRPYNLTISHQYRFVWFQVAKVGTRTILNHFRADQIGMELHHSHWVRYVPVRFACYFKFAFVRNPWDRLISCYEDKVVKHNLYRFDEPTLAHMRDDFRNFVQHVEGLDVRKCERHLRLQSALIDLNEVEYVGRMEHFGNDFAAIRQRLSLPAADIVRRGSSESRKPYQDYYDDELRDRVGKIYQKDIQVFGYVFGG